MMRMDQVSRFYDEYSEPNPQTEGAIPVCKQINKSKRERLFQYHKDISAAALHIMEKKNHDYAGEGGNHPFANFERCESMGICSTEQGFLVRITDKLSRLSTFAAAGTLKVENESFEDAIVDIINYMVLFGAYCQEKANKNAE